ncbi:MAG: asparagine synthetase B [Bacteroidetes bacterium]|nr:asparagine synthetase B [Bacteroidota bacterium]
MMRTVLILFLGVVLTSRVEAQDVLIPMDNSQSDHLKAYGVTFWALERRMDVDWLLNYRGGSFLVTKTPELEAELRVRGVSYLALSGSQTASLISTVESDASNTSVVRLEQPPRIAVYAPQQTLPWDDAVLLALSYAEVPYEMIYDDDVLDGALEDFDWVHLHHEDFTGQYGKFFNYRSTPWYIEQQRQAEIAARARGFRKVSELKLRVVEIIKQYVGGGGFLFAMCSGADSFDIALAAHATDIVPEEYDGDPIDPDALSQLDFAQTFAFADFRPIFNAREYEHSDIDSGPPPPQLRNPAVDYFTLFEFSAKYDQVPTMLTQSHVATIKGFIGQTTNFVKKYVKPNVVILAEAPGRGEVRYLNGTFGEGTFTFYGGHDPEDYQHFVGDEPTDLSLHKHSPGYRLILNNILFPAAKKKNQKT